MTTMNIENLTHPFQGALCSFVLLWIATDTLCEYIGFHSRNLHKWNHKMLLFVWVLSSNKMMKAYLLLSVLTVHSLFIGE